MTTEPTLYSIIESLENTSSRLAKEAILKRQIDNKLLKWFFELSLNPFINFYIRKMPEMPELSYDKNYDSYARLTNAFNNLGPIIKREITGNAAIEHLSDILCFLNFTDRDIIRRIIGKSPDCGVSESTVNKIWPGFIPEYPCMLCSQYDEKVMKKISYPAFFQLKADGMRFNAIVKDGTVEYRSRNGKLLDLKGYLNPEFLAMAGSDKLVFDGELLIYQNGKPASRTYGNGILQKTGKGTGTDKEASMIGCMLWDVIQYDAFLSGKYSVGYKQRFFDLQYRVNNLRFSDHKVHIIPTSTIYSLEEVQGLLEMYLEQGQEGGILKNYDSPWEDKRSRQQIKFKGELECDLLCTGWIEHKKEKNWLGALTLESKDGKIKVNVGSGFNEKHRKDIKAKDIIGKIISVKYNCRIADKRTGQESLFLPVFQELRMDKDIADSSKNIK